MREACVVLFAVVLSCATACVPPGGGGGGGGGSCDDCRPEAGSSELEVGDVSASLVEGGPGVTTALKLKRAPMADVTVTVVSLSPTVASADPSSLVFTPDNWSGSQIVTLTAADDNEVTGAREVEIEFTMQSEDSSFSNRPVNSLFIDVLEDDELPSVEVEAEGGAFEVSEDGESLTLQLTLSAQPDEDVLVPLSVDDEDELTLSATTLTFGALDWNLPQEVTLTGRDDREADGDKSVILSVGPTNSLDDLFNQIPALEVTIVSLDGVCGNGVVDGDEPCDGSGSSRTCDYGERSCTYCTDSCEEAPGTVSGYCGDGTIQRGDGETCDEPSERCPYGQMSCQTCTDQCKTGPGVPSGFCGDGIVQSSEEACDPGVSPCCNEFCESDTSSCGPDCLIISEYLEGLSNNKAIELYNCGPSSETLAGVKVCLVSNSNTTCSATYSLTGSIASGDTLTICNPQIDPSLGIPCDVTNGSIMGFNGDDRLVVWVDVDGDGVLTSADTISDAFGQTSSQPFSTDEWGNQILSRCDQTPYDGMSFFSAYSYFNGRDPFNDPSAYDGFGQPPNESCGL